MFVFFISDRWALGPQNSKRRGVVVDDKTMKVASAAPSIGYLKGQTMEQIIRWGLSHGHEVQITRSLIDSS